MIELVTVKELSELWVRFEEVKERTLRHTKQIQELQSKLREFERGKKK
ncbi:hypothetical protein LCGC14_0956280 [marine sediment metagenome]|uniref:Uncharacterized protein n=1 Tax=marine sediment metagenome TaxID=412755 RepID=A0A0F9P1Z6_9ZZZZ